MSNSVRSILQKKIFQALTAENSINPKVVDSYLRLDYDQSSQEFIYKLPLKTKNYHINQEIFQNDITLSSDISYKFNEPWKSVLFSVDKNYFTKKVLESFSQEIKPPIDISETNENIVVEFSSLNIAKPFHIGHLRSTVIGNFISNINTFFNNKVKKINYLGDWGTQFGFIQLGLSLAKIDNETVKKDPVQSLYNAYVYANKLAEEDPCLADQARLIFTKLESGDENISKEWEVYRNFTVTELKNTYNRLGVTFDEYQWESMYNKNNVSDIISELENLKLLYNDSENRKAIKINDKKSIPLLKSNGSTLYLTRDIAAAIDRHKKFNFDKMYYVVDNSQADHFINLIEILKSMNFAWANQLKHIKFGKVRGMSTRKGTAVFLKDFLDEIKILIREKQIQKETTKVNLDLDESSTEILGISAVIINDFKHKRHQDYTFDWESALNVNSSMGVRLQYTHCRLVSLEENCGAVLPEECDPTLLQEIAAQDLIFMIATFDEAVIECYNKLEPYILVKYLFKLSQAINRALNQLRIKGVSSELANQRLLLMHSARNVLGKGMKLLGVIPLKKM